MKPFLDEIRVLNNQYYEWLKDNTILHDISDGTIEINSPFINHQNDHIQIYVKRYSDVELLITDYGDTVANLEMAGCNISGHRKEMFEKTLKSFGIKLNKTDNSLYSIATKLDFNHKKHNFLQSILSINDLFYTSRSNVVSLFNEEVTKWLEEIEAPFISDVKFTGESGFDHRFDFVISKSKSKPARFIKLINNPDKDSWRQSMDFIDVSKVREFKSIVLLNDNGKNTDKLIRAFSTCEIEAVNWSSHQQNKDVFVA
jgi:hypothetical protein